MLSSIIRRATMMVALPAVAAGVAATPAIADDHGSENDYKNRVHVTICKEVRKDNGDYYNNKDDKGKNDKFKLHVATYGYVDQHDVKIKNGDCKDVDLRFDAYNKKVVVKEYDTPKGYKFENIECYNDHGNYYSYDKKTCDFQGDWVKVVVINKVKKQYQD